MKTTTFRSRTRAVLHFATVAFAVVALLTAAGCESVKPVEVRGPLVENRLVKTSEARGMVVQLVSGKDCLPRFLVTDLTGVTAEYVPQYQKMLRFAQDGERETDKIRYVPVEGELIAGEAFVETRQASSGPLAGLPMEINGTAGMTDRQGLFADSSQELLAAFDNFGTVSLELRPAAVGRGADSIRVSRGELLNSLGVDMELDRRFPAAHENIVYKMDAPAEVRPGQTFEIRLWAENRGAKKAFGVHGRSISRHAWLDGKNFYIGKLEPGEKRSFRRVFRVPAVAPRQAHHAVLGIACVLGAAPANNLPLTILVKP